MCVRVYVYPHGQRRNHLFVQRIHRRFTYKGDTSTHAQGTDHRRFTYKGDRSTHAQGTDHKDAQSLSHEVNDDCHLFQDIDAYT